ncbi:hypothetical protein Bca52824_053831 [Brassica carinata]|uniref:DUF1985 domain-containing protein n=1 Tax=Brassica carinata TaxID=52824 RepID=A0A8X7R6C2_BRACI|nr:hypothetical protein Bca52824_053831 [Brassica carinata]
MVEEAVIVKLKEMESIKTSSVGVIVKLKEMDYTWSAKAVHHLLTNQLVVNNIHEIWSVIEGQPIRLSLYEFGQITGFNCEPFDINDKVEVDHKPFWEEIGVSPSHGPMFSELRLLLTHIRNWSFEKRRMIGLLSVLSIGVLGISPGSRICGMNISAESDSLSERGQTSGDERNLVIDGNSQFSLVVCQELASTNSSY